MTATATKTETAEKTLTADIGEITSGHVQSSSDTSGIWLEGSSVAPTTTWTDFVNLTPASSRTGRDQDYLHFESSARKTFTVNEKGEVDIFGGDLSIQSSSDNRVAFETTSGGTRGEVYVSNNDNLTLESVLNGIVLKPATAGSGGMNIHLADQALNFIDTANATSTDAGSTQGYLNVTLDAGAFRVPLLATS